MQVVMRKIRDLKPYKNNAKKHPKEQVNRIAESIKEFGFTQPVLIDKHNEVVVGHGRILGAKQAGLKEVPTVMLEDLTEEQIKAYRLIDNKLNESDWDYMLLDQELQAIAGLDMFLFGFGTDEDMSMFGVTTHKTGDYKYKHFLVTFEKEDQDIEKLRDMLIRRGVEYIESQN